jgi:hypothetical protein
MENRPPPTSLEIVLTCLHATLTVVIVAVLVSAAALAPAPALVLPLVVLVCVGGPMVAAWELRSVLPHLRRHRAVEVPPLDDRALARLRRRLDQLPETPHPLGL